MEKKNKKILLITSAILLIGGGVGYWLWKRNKDKKAEETPAAEETPSSESTTPSGGGGTTVEDKPANVLAFQQYANSKGWSPKLVEDGIWGSKSKAAWAKWGAEFKKPKGLVDWGTIYNNPVKPTPTTSQSNVFKKGDAVYSRMRNVDLFQYPTGNTLMGNITLSDEKFLKQIAVFDSYIGDFAKVWMNINGVALNGTLIRAPYWAYVYKSTIKK